MKLPLQHRGIVTAGGVILELGGNAQCGSLPGSDPALRVRAPYPRQICEALRVLMAKSDLPHYSSEFSVAEIRFE